MNPVLWGVGGALVGLAAGEIVVALVRTRHRYYQAFMRRKRTGL